MLEFELEFVFESLSELEFIESEFLLFLLFFIFFIFLFELPFELS